MLPAASLARRDDPGGPLTVIEHDRAGWICVRMTYDFAGCRTRLHAHCFDHWMRCEHGLARVEIEGVETIVRAGDRYLVAAGKRHGVLALQSGTVLLCEHEVRAENGQHDPEAFSPDGIPVEWLRRLTETWGPERVAR